MCGIAGVVCGTDVTNLHSIVLEMTQSLVHRGPDGSGVWISPCGNVALGHRRLSILDLSEAGAQPMISESGRTVISFNGEIYNHLDLRECLSRELWRGTSDTETVLYAIEEKGLGWLLERATGMFALAVYDTERRTLSLANDKFGEKPLYYALTGGVFLFGSELKALKISKQLQLKIDKPSLALYTRFGYVPAPRTIYENVNKITPGTYIKIPFKQGRVGAPVTSVYWNIEGEINKALSRPFDGSFESAIEEGERLIFSSVSSRLLSDVPVGGFLSGGIDSSLIAALMQKASSRKIRTFTMGFAEEGYDESQQARSIADWLDTDHTELLVTSDLALKTIPKLPILYDEPFSDSSQIPTYLLSKLTSEHVTVALSGDAGDEIFGGYNRHTSVVSLWRRLSLMPVPVRQAVADLLRSVSPNSLATAYSLATHISPNLDRLEHFPDKVQKLAKILNCKSINEVYLSLVSTWEQPGDVVVNASEPAIEANNIGGYPFFDDFEHTMMYLDSKTYLPGDILTKVDRASMGVSLETRLPFLDHHIFQFAWSLPLNYKVRGGKGKILLRAILDKHVPTRLWDRPKKGFSIPLDVWLRGPLKEWANDLLDLKKLEGQGYFNSAAVSKFWGEHLKGKHNWQDKLWNILMFQAWLEDQNL